MTGGAATKRALFELAPASCYVHLATHGYFADERIRSWSEGMGEQGGRTADIVTGMAPATLCGLALAGANGEATLLGRVPGIVTAEELAGLDLGSRELAVLSACDTRIGLGRADQGLASLQAALHAAGARATITSLWSVPDEATKRPES